MFFVTLKILCSSAHCTHLKAHDMTHTVVHLSFTPSAPPPLQGNYELG